MGDQAYRINLEDRFGKSTLIDIPAQVAAVGDEWVNQTLTTVNDAVVRLGIVKGEFHWHKHDEQDEFFLVLDGRLLLDIQDADTVFLDRHQAYTVPSGVPHRSRAPERTVLLMIEPAGVVPTGD
jgi:mannose-6-phosphate isomerase-like protein (cupin superfamily)